MKRYIIAIFILLMALASCQNKSTEDSIDIYDTINEEFEFETFYPVEANDSFVEEYKKAYFASEYFIEPYTNVIFYNYIPDHIFNNYNIGAFKIQIVGIDSYHFLYHDGVIKRIEPFEQNGDKGFSHFVLTDCDHDNNKELICSFYYWGSYLQVSYLAALDTKSNLIITTSSIHDRYVYFKEHNNKLGIFLSEEKDINKADYLSTYVKRNNRKYSFMMKKYNVEALTFSADVTLDEFTINFPLSFGHLGKWFIVDVSMRYLGNSFSYINSSTYLDGALATFKNDTGEISRLGYGIGGDAMTEFTIATGMVIEKTYAYIDYTNEPNNPGIYDMVISYRGDSVVIEDVVILSII